MKDNRERRTFLHPLGKEKQRFGAVPPEGRSGGEPNKSNDSKGHRTVARVYHMQSVNNMDIRMRKFMRSFNGGTKIPPELPELVVPCLGGYKENTALAFASKTAPMKYKNIALNSMLIRT